MRFPPDPQWLEGQYNNRARIPEHAQIFARWAQDSASARERYAPVLDLAYGASAAETLDVFMPRRDGAPVLVFIHGGWWRALDKADHSFVAPAFVEAGACVVVPNYGLCPAVTIETITWQMVRALVWTWRHIAAYGGDPHRIVVAGHSAGGHLTAMMLSCRWPQVAVDLPADVVKAGLSISGVFDLEPIRLTPFLQADLRLRPQDVARLSPAYFPPPGSPLWATVGALESEEFLRQNRLIRQRWGRRAVPVCETIAAAHHLNILDSLARPGQRLHALALEMLGRV
ncbi:MAG: alpha/beta hydrolase [Caldimonas manganoxidans]|nr:alpha/beta hydrolase [Caldimonas manganoxidans]